jgi:hypothetical protein
MRETGAVLWALAFDRIGIIMSDLYFVDPNLDQGAEGAERGVRIELRMFQRDELKGSVYSAVPIRVDRSGASTCSRPQIRRPAASTAPIITRGSTVGSR